MHPSSLVSSDGSISQWQEAVKLRVFFFTHLSLLKIYELFSRPWTLRERGGILNAVRALIGSTKRRLTRSRPQSAISNWVVASIKPLLLYCSLFLPVQSTFYFGHWRCSFRGLYVESLPSSIYPLVAPPWGNWKFLSSSEFFFKYEVWPAVPNSQFLHRFHLYLPRVICQLAPWHWPAPRTFVFRYFWVILSLGLLTKEWRGTVRCRSLSQQCDTEGRSLTPRWRGRRACIENIVLLTFI